MRIVSAKDYSRAELQRRTQSGRLQRVATGIYSEDTDRSPEEIVARDWRAIVATVMPDAVISYASAFTSLPHDGEFDVAHTRRTPLLLPGLTVRSDGVGRRWFFGRWGGHGRQSRPRIRVGLCPSPSPSPDASSTA